MVSEAEIDRAIREVRERRLKGMSHNADASGSIVVPGKAQREEHYAKQVADVLLRHYPGHKWQIGVDVSNEGLVLINIKIPTLDGLWGFTIKTDRTYVSEKIVRDAAGELLERWGLSRGKADEAEYAAVERRAGVAVHDD